MAAKHRELYVPYKTMVEMMVESTFSSNNVYGVVDRNISPYSNMAMDAMKINQGYAGECSIIDEELNTDATKFFDLLKESDKLLWYGCTKHSKLSVFSQVFTIKSDLRLSKVGYYKIIEWARSTLL